MHTHTPNAHPEPRPQVMQFYAGIILPRGWPASRRAARVKEVLSEMGLTHVAGTIVGGQVRAVRLPATLLPNRL